MTTTMTHRVLLDATEAVRMFREDVLLMEEIQCDLSEIVSTYVEYNDRDGDERAAIRWCYVDPKTETPTADGERLYQAVVNFWRALDQITIKLDFHICRCILSSDDRTIILTGSYHQ